MLGLKLSFTLHDFQELNGPLDVSHFHFLLNVGTIVHTLSKTKTEPTSQIIVDFAKYICIDNINV